MKHQIELENLHNQELKVLFPNRDKREKHLLKKKRKEN